jgi:hypothetical protein
MIKSVYLWWLPHGICEMSHRGRLEVGASSLPFLTNSGHLRNCSRILSSQPTLFVKKASATRKQNRRENCKKKKDLHGWTGGGAGLSSPRRWRYSASLGPSKREMRGGQDKQVEKRKKIANMISLMTFENHETVAVLPQREEKS